YGSLVMRAMTTLGQTRRGAGDASPPGTTTARAVLFTGVGGPAMRDAGLVPLGDAGSMGVTGFLEVLGSATAIWRSYRAARGLLSSSKPPELALLIDYPDFNLRLASHARKVGVPVLYFVSPQIWAWRRGRVRQIAATVDRMLVILPFEEAIYRQ